MIFHNVPTYKDCQTNIRFIPKTSSPSWISQIFPDEQNQIYDYYGFLKEYYDAKYQVKIATRLCTRKKNIPAVERNNHKKDEINYFYEEGQKFLRQRAMFIVYNKRNVILSLTQY